ncbi:prolipoprotein diacylglyceryl transferase, partial [Candidatus Dojkabacteria bacterium]|nr:prolipoprotein diacylglyceryl transferase [Candidatus Dojkabacteria bacterium]
GRLGNLFNHELYGPPTDLPWGVFIRPANRLPGYESYNYFHPLFLYEAVGNLILFALLYRAYKKGEVGQRMLALYIAGYGIIRYLLDFLRLEGVSGIYGLSYTQWGILGLFIFAFVFGVAYQLWHKRKYGKWFTDINEKIR